MNLSVIDFPPAINAEHVDGKYVKQMAVVSFEPIVNRH